MLIEHRKTIDTFLEKYRSLYPNYVQEDFKSKIYNGYTLNNDIINQIYCYLKLVNLKNTDYYHFFQYLEKNHFLKGEILEVGCGAIPILANLIYEQHYKITALDKNIIIKDFYFDLLIEEFNDSFRIQKYDNIIAFRPCMATENIIRNCLKYNIPFCIYLCNCALYPQEIDNTFDEKNWSNQDWVRYLENIIKKYNEHNMVVKIDYNTNMFDKCPIIFANRMHKNVV